MGTIIIMLSYLAAFMAFVEARYRLRAFKEETVDENGLIQVGETTVIRQKIKKYSDGLANGDSVDDKEIEDEWDPSDDIVDDNGFVRNWGLPTRPPTTDDTMLNQFIVTKDT